MTRRPTCCWGANPQLLFTISEPDVGHADTNGRSNSSRNASETATVRWPCRSYRSRSAASWAPTCNYPHGPDTAPAAARHRGSPREARRSASSDARRPGRPCVPTCCRAHAAASSRPPAWSAATSHQPLRCRGGKCLNWSVRRRRRCAAGPRTKVKALKAGRRAGGAGVLTPAEADVHRYGGRDCGHLRPPMAAPADHSH